MALVKKTRKLSGSTTLANAANLDIFSIELPDKHFISFDLQVSVTSLGTNDEGQLWRWMGTAARKDSPTDPTPPNWSALKWWSPTGDGKPITSSASGIATAPALTLDDSGDPFLVTMNVDNTSGLKVMVVWEGTYTIRNDDGM
jgi:hypothetical protein